MRGLCGSGVRDHARLWALRRGDEAMAEIEVIRWSESLMTGVDEIDRQHRVLVNTLNEIIESLPGGCDEALAERITRDLLGYALYHFEMEEELMERHGYGDFSSFDARSHVAQHKAFADRVSELRERFNGGSRLDLERLVRFLHDWLTNHIMGSDVRLGQFILDARRKERGA